MYRRSIIAILFIIVFFSCTKHKDIPKNEYFTPKSVETKGYIVPDDTLVEPEIVLLDKPTVVSAGAPQIIATNKNVQNCKNPLKVFIGSPRVIVPGKDTFLLPKTIPANRNHFLAGQPEVIIAKDAYIKDRNPENFRSFTKLQGLQHNVIRCMLQDKMGNLWFGTDGGGATKYDGKYFTNYTEKEGLCNNDVLSMLQDQSGNLWFGTNAGVSKYDGKFFTTYTVEDGLVDNIVYCIIQDNNKNIWFGTNNGASKFREAHQTEEKATFTNFKIKEGLIVDNIRCIQQDRRGNIWFGTNGGGVLKYNGEISPKGEASFEVYTIKEGLNSNFILSIFQDNLGNLWFGSDGGGVSMFNGEIQPAGQASIIKFTEKDGLSNDVVRSILQDKRGNLWFGTDGGGISKLTQSSIGSSINYSFTNYTENEGLINNTIRCNLQDQSGNLWFGTAGGVSKFDGKIFTHFTKNEGLSNNTIRCMLKDQQGNMWFGTDGGGVLKHDEKSQSSKMESFTNYSTKNGLINNNVLSILQDSIGNLWFGTDEGISKYNGEYKRDGMPNFYNYTLKEGLYSNVIYSLLHDKWGNIWLGTDGGCISKLSTFNIDGSEKYALTHYTKKEGLSEKSVYSIMQDKNRNLWFGTYGEGVIKLDRSSVEVINNDKKLLIEANQEQNISKQKQITIPNANKIKVTHYTDKEGLSNNNVLCIFQDNMGYFWFGTNGGGVSMYNGKTFTHYTENEGLCNNTVRSIQQDRNGNLWFGTRFGLSKLSQKNLEKIYNDANQVYEVSSNKNHQPILFKNYTYDDGFLGIECNRGAICEDNKGQIWIGTIDRLTVYHPDGDESDTLPPNIQLIAVELFNENIDWANINPETNPSIKLRNGVTVKEIDFDETSYWYGLPDNLSLRYNANFLSFRFIGITQNHSKKVNYQYKLDGLDVNWSAPSQRNEAVYGNLPPGKFTFRIKAMNSEGYWSKEYIYNFIIRPPWWKTWWAYLGTSIIVIVCLFGFYHLRLATLRNQKKQLERIVKEQTVEVVNQRDELVAYNEELTATNEELYNQREELESTLNTLHSTQGQLIQSEKMASIGILAAGVAHEINNPLNFIHGGILGLESYLNENTKEHIEEVKPLIEAIQEGVSRASNIVTSLNHYSRREDYFRTESNIHEIIENCLVMLQNQTKNRIEIVKNYTNDNYKLKCNEGKLHQVMLNLLANASQSIANKGTITITTIIENEMIVISIADTGCGISEENLPKIMDPFYTTKETGKGTGLGLSICYNIIQEHNGTIIFESIVGKGTKAIIKLPI